jgi:hypothetical protein
MSNILQIIQRRFNARRQYKPEYNECIPKCQVVSVHARINCYKAHHCGYNIVKNDRSKNNN